MDIPPSLEIGTCLRGKKGRGMDTSLLPGCGEPSVCEEYAKSILKHSLPELDG